MACDMKPDKAAAPRKPRIDEIIMHGTVMIPIIPSHSAPFWYHQTGVWMVHDTIVRCRSFFGARVLGYGTLVAILSLLSSEAFAHARWFLVNETIEPAPPMVFDHIYATTIACMLIFAAGAISLQNLSRRHSTVDRLLNRPFSVPNMLGWRLLSIALGSTLISNSMMHVFVAPNLPARHNMWFVLIMFAQIIVGAALVMQSRMIPATLAVLLLAFPCWALYSFLEAIDYAFELAGIGIALFLVAPALSSVNRDLVTGMFKRTFSNLNDGGPGLFRAAHSRSGAEKNHPHTIDAEGVTDREQLAASVLRVMIGLQLMVLTAHDKLIEPGVSLAFVEKYSFVNVPALLGATQFTNLHFVVGAGLAELTFGAMLVCDIATRAICLILLGIFVLTGFIFGLDELIGHLPIVASLLVLIGIGSAKAGRHGHDCADHGRFPDVAGGPGLITSQSAVLPRMEWNMGDQVATNLDHEGTRMAHCPVEAGLDPMKAQGSDEIQARHADALVFMDVVKRAIHAISIIPQIRGFHSNTGSRGNHE